MNITKTKLKAMFLRLIKDCDMCDNKETIKQNIIEEAKWLGLELIQEATRGKER